MYKAKTSKNSEQEDKEIERRALAHDNIESIEIIATIQPARLSFPRLL